MLGPSRLFLNPLWAVAFKSLGHSVEEVSFSGCVELLVVCRFPKYDALQRLCSCCGLEGSTEKKENWKEELESERVGCSRPNQS